MSEIQKNLFHDLKNCIYNIRNSFFVLKKNIPSNNPDSEVIKTALAEVEKTFEYIKKIQSSFKIK